MTMPFRIKYFLSHLLISLFIASASFFLIFYVWYPDPLQKALGVGELVVMMLVIDVILGPILTLIIAKQGKKSLKMDLTVIAVVQLIALLYGLYSIDKGRPVAIAFDINRFELVPKHMIIGDEHKAILQQYKDNQAKNIPIVAVRPAKDEKEYIERMNNELERNLLSSANPTLYETIKQNFVIIQTNSKPIQDLTKFNDKQLVETTLASYPTADSFALITASAKNMTVLIDSKNQQVLGVVDLRPW